MDNVRQRPSWADRSMKEKFEHRRSLWQICYPDEEVIVRELRPLCATSGPWISLS